MNNGFPKWMQFRWNRTMNVYTTFSMGIVSIGIIRWCAALVTSWFVIQYHSIFRKQLQIQFFFVQRCKLSRCRSILCHLVKKIKNYCVLSVALVLRFHSNFKQSWEKIHIFTCNIQWMWLRWREHSHWLWFVRSFCFLESISVFNDLLKLFVAHWKMISSSKRTWFSRMQTFAQRCFSHDCLCIEHCIFFLLLMYINIFSSVR